MDCRRKCTCGEVLYGDSWKTPKYGHRVDPETGDVTSIPVPGVDMVKHPPHYKQHPSGVECITVTEHFNFNVGNAIKYLWRSDYKNGLEDLKKAAWYVNREIERLSPTEDAALYVPRVGDTLEFKIGSQTFFSEIVVTSENESFITNNYTAPITIRSLLNVNSSLEWLVVTRDNKPILQWRKNHGFVKDLLYKGINL